MKNYLRWMAVIALLLAPGLALAEEPSAPVAADFSPPEVTEQTSRWGRFVAREIEHLESLDLYGVTAQLPAGYLSMKWDWGTIRAGNRYNNRRELGPVMEPISFKDGNGNEIVNIDLGLAGHGGGHTFQFSYGITDPLDWYIEFPFTYMNVSFNPKVSNIKGPDGKEVVDGEGNPYKVHPTYAPLLGIKDPVAYDGCEFLYETLPALGRPSPAANYKGKWMLGDINTGFSWNVYRTPRFSVALTPRIYLPTGHKPNPNSNLLWGTGPEIETGIGGWAIGFTQGYDVRLFKAGYWFEAIASTEFAASYAFPQQREYPTNFPVPSPAASQLDPTAFPDLSHLEGTFTYTPGFGASWTSQLQLHVLIFGLGAAYGIQYNQEPELIGDRAFLMMAKGLELLGQSTLEAVQLAGSVSLLPLFYFIDPSILVPIEVAFQYRKAIDGYNAIVFDDFYQLTVKAVFPLKIIWDL